MTSERTTHSAQLGPLTGRLAGTLTLLVGGMALVGWAFDITVLKSIRPDWVSMKPNTALCFVLVGLALLATRERLSTLSPQLSTAVSRLSRLCALLAGLIGLLSLAEYAFDWNLGFDQWLFPEPAGAVGTSHPGRMAPDTAICFALLAMGLEIARASRVTTGRVFTAVTIGALVTTIGLVEILSYFAPLLRTHGWGGLTMMALPTAILFTALGAALIGIPLSRKTTAPDGSVQPFGPSDVATSLRFSLISTGLAVGILGTGLFYYRTIERRFRIDAEQQLAVIADLKVGELVQWRSERLGDGSILHNNPVFTQLVRRFLASPADADASRALQAWFGKFQAHYMYDRVSLVDVQGTERLPTLATSEPVCSHVSANLAAILKSGRVTLMDFHREAPGRPIHLSVLVPILDEADGRRPLGLIILQIDPARYLYPLISRWTAPSETAETLLVRREGDEAVFLNELRFQKYTALTLRPSLANTSMPAVQAALGQEGVVEGVDYRGVPVLAALRAIPDSPWFMVARRDVAEVFAPLRAQLWQVIVLVGVLLFAAGTGVGFVWRQQRVRFYRGQAESAEELQRNQALLTQAEELGRVGGWEFDIETKQQTWTKTVYDIHELDRTVHPTVAQGVNCYTPESQPILARAVQRAIDQGEPFDVELEIITAKGNRRSVHVVGRADRARGKVSGFIQDITERKQAEAEIRIKNQVFDDSIAAQSIADKDGGLTHVNPAFLRLWGSATKEDAIGKSVASFFANPAEATLALEALAAQDAWNGEFLARRPDGTTFISRGYASSLRNAAGELVGYQSTNLDVTRERESEEKFSTAFKISPYAITITRARDGEFIEVNDAFTTISGFTREEAYADSSIGLRLWMNSEDRDRVVNDLRAGRTVDGHEYPFRTKGDKIFMGSFSARAILLGGEPCILSNIADITERKQTEAELAETKALLQAALDHSQAGIAIADAPSGRLRYVNQAGLLIGGGTEAELVAGLDVNQYVASWNLFNLDGTSLAKAEVPLARAVLFGEPCTREFIIRRSEHDDRIVLANAAPIRNQAGAVTAGIVVFLDITEHKRAEDLLRQNTEELRARNEELTRFNRLMAGRELRTIELKQQVNDLAAQLGQSRPYPLAFLDAAAAEVVRTTPKPGEQGAEIRGQKSEVSDQKSEVSNTQKEKSP